MAFNTRRAAGEVLNAVGSRRNQPLSNNFTPGGQLPAPNRTNQQPQQQNRPVGPPANGRGQQQQQQAQQRMPPPQLRQPHNPIPQNNTPAQQKSVPVQQNLIPPKVEESDQFLNKEEPMEIGEQSGKGKPFWVTRTVSAAGRISKKERQRRRNVRLSKMLQPKNAVMILNELVKSATYTVTDLVQPTDVNQYSATVLVDGVSHVGHGRSKMDSKSMAAENALKYIVKNRQFSALKKTEEGEEKMDVAEDGTPMLPWQHVASFALYKLLHSWGEDPNQPRGTCLQSPEGDPTQTQINKPAKKMPENAPHMNPLMLLNQMLPQTQFEELGRTGISPNLSFTFKCLVNDQSFSGTGSNKKAAKKMAAFAVCNKVLGVQYPPEIYTPAN